MKLKTKYEKILNPRKIRIISEKSSSKRAFTVVPEHVSKTGRDWDQIPLLRATARSEGHRLRVYVICVFTRLLLLKLVAHNITLSPPFV